MTKLEVKTPQSGGTLYIAGTPLGKGGEGAVYSVDSHSVAGLPPAEELVVKIYHNPTEGSRREKVISMVSSPPDSEMFAWPLAVAAENGRFVGYVMEKLQADRMKEWAHLAHTATRQNLAPEFDVRYAITACFNLAIATQSAHNAGHRLGDVLNESNAAIASNAAIILLDTDSAQIKSRQGQIFRCEVGKPEYTAAELIGRPLREQERTVATDAFAIGVLFFQMLTGGAHQTDGIYTGAEDPPSTISKISQGIFPMLRDESTRGFKPVPRIAAEGIPLKLQGLLLSLSDTQPERRPDFKHIIEVLQSVQQNLIQCSQHKAHWYDSRDGGCGWCSHASKGQPDPWSEEATLQQSKLPPVSFSQQKAPEGKAPRAALQPSRHQSGYAPTAIQQKHQQSPPVSTTHPLPTQYVAPSTQLSQQAQQLLQQANAQPQQQQQSQTASPTPAPQQSQPKPQQSQVPAKIKGKMTVIYPDGSHGPRPPLGVLFSQNNRLWREAIAVEWPDALKFWWPSERSGVASIPSILIAPVLALATIITTVMLLGKYVIDASATPAVRQIGEPLLLLGAVCSAAVFCIWWLAAWIGRFKAKRLYGYSDNESFFRTQLRVVVLAVSYLFTPVIVGISVLVLTLKTIISHESRSRSRW